MNVSGIRMNQTLGEMLLPSIDELTIDELRNLPVFSAFSWSGFRKAEFANLLRLFLSLYQSGPLSGLPLDQPFVFNYSLGGLEMDIVTVVSIGGEEVFLDIESKDDPLDPELCEKVRAQVDGRKENLKEYLKDKPFIVFGYANGNYCEGFDSARNLFLDSDCADAISATFAPNPEVDTFLLQSASIAKIVSAAKKIRQGTYPYYRETNRHFDNLVEQVSSGLDACIVYGNAGTGKSVSALKLYYELPGPKHLLLLNSKLYNCFDLGVDYLKKGATFSSSKFLDWCNKDTVAIVDECQRESIETIAKIIRASRFTFLFGDHKQCIKRSGTLLCSKDLAKALKEKYGLSCSLRPLKKPRRYSDAVDKALSQLTMIDCKKSEIQRIPDNFKIRLYYREEDFLNAYDQLGGLKKIYVPIVNSRVDPIIIAGRQFWNAKYDDDGFSVWSHGSNVIGNTYHALSFDVDHSFVYLPHACLIPFQGKKRIFFTKGREPLNFEEIQCFLNELNVLFTRARESLHILVKDMGLYLRFSGILAKMAG